MFMAQSCQFSILIGPAPQFVRPGYFHHHCCKAKAVIEYSKKSLSLFWTNLIVVCCSQENAQQINDVGL